MSGIFTFVVPDGAKPGDMIQVWELGICLEARLPKETFAGQRLTRTYTTKDYQYGKRWQVELSDWRERWRRRLESGKHVPVKSDNHDYGQYVVLSQRVRGQAIGKDGRV